MHYFSTNRRSPAVNFRDAVLKGQPDDKGLYFPGKIVVADPDLTKNATDLSNAEVAFKVIRPYVDGEIPDGRLFDICAHAVDFDFPLVKITDRISTLELFHGPTLAFKDVGARFISGCLDFFSDSRDKKTVVIVATSGDTGGAVANGFSDAKDVNVVILYPKGRVSRIQELQLTTAGNNVITLEVRGTFDDCQFIAKSLLADGDLNKKAFLTSANSINIARWLPQQFYYWFLLKNWQGERPKISVPSGNYGNIAAGLLAHRSGLPANGFVAACNSNDIIPRYFVNGKYDPRQTIHTLSNAMDVGNPSNFVRILEIFDNTLGNIADVMLPFSISDAETAETMKRVFETKDHVLDPHSAVAFAALEKALSPEPDVSGVIMGTAHPVKFDSVKEIVGTQGTIPPSVSGLEQKQQHRIEVDADVQTVKDLLVNRVL